MEDDCICIDTELQTINHDSANVSSSTNNEAYPSKLAELVAQKVKIKKEKQEKQNNMLFPPMLFNNQQGQQQSHQMQYITDVDLLPKTPLENQALIQLRQMGFNNNDVEIMMALRFVQNRRGGMTSNFCIEMLIEETMLHIVTQREEESEARKMDIAREQSEIIASQEKILHKSSDNQILMSAAIDEIIGKQCTGNCNNNNNTSDINTSVYFPSSTLLTLGKVKNQFRDMLNSSSFPNITRGKIICLLTLEKNAFKWYGNKIPFAYFGITLPERMSKWSVSKENGEKIVKQLQDEIEHIEHAMYSLSEQQQGDLGLMIPKKFLKAREDAITQGLLPNNEDKIIILDD